MAFDLNTLGGSVLRNGAYGSTFPFSFFAVAQHNSLATEAYIGGCGRSGASDSNYLLAFRGDISGDPIAARRIAAGGGGSNTPASSVAYSINTPYKVLGVFAGAADVRLYVNGSKYTTTTSVGAPTTMSHQVIGSYYDGGVANQIGGPIQQFAVWEIDLTDDDYAMLNAGFSPRRVRPKYLRSYAPCIRELNDMCYGAYTGNNLTIANHMRTYGM